MELTSIFFVRALSLFFLPFFGDALVPLIQWLGLDYDYSYSDVGWDLPEISPCFRFVFNMDLEFSATPAWFEFRSLVWENRDGEFHSYLLNLRIYFGF